MMWEGRWLLGMGYVVAVAVIWIAASFVVQSVVDSGVSPFLITYICNSLFLLYLPLVELLRLFRPHQAKGQPSLYGLDPAREPLLNPSSSELQKEAQGKDSSISSSRASREWSRKEIARSSLIVCPFWFLAQFTFNLSLKYTTVTSNTILSTASSLFTFLMSWTFLGEKFTWLKFCSVFFCMGGTIVVSLADSEKETDNVATNPVLGDILCIVSAVFYALYTTLIRKLLPDEEKQEGKASTALFFGFLGLFNALLFLPIALILHFTGVEPFRRLSLTQVGLITGKGLIDNVLSDYLWAKAVLLTTTTAATAGLSIQVPIAAVVDSLRGHMPTALDLVGGIIILLGFLGINQPTSGGFHAKNDTIVDSMGSNDIDRTTRQPDELERGNDVEDSKS